MLSLITGGQRAGKTYFCVTLIIDFLRNTKMPVYTNLPLQPDVLADIACRGRLRFPVLYRSYLERLKMFVNFRGKRRQEFKFFRARNPDYVSLHRDGIKLMIDSDKITTFWRHITPNSVIFLDEVYQFFSSLDQSISAKLELRKEMLTYSRQHGHLKDELYLVSHDKADIDSRLRAGVQYIYEVSNSKYTNIFELSFLKGIKYPYQFFWVRGWLRGDTADNPSDTFTIHPSKAIFTAYDSFSRPETLELSLADEDALSRDSAVDNTRMMHSYFSTMAPQLVFIFCTAVFFIVLFYYLLSGYGSSTKATISPGSPGVARLDISGTSSVIDKPVFISSECIKFSNNQTIKKGVSYNGYFVQQISKDGVSCVNRGVTSLFSPELFCKLVSIESTGTQTTGNKSTSIKTDSKTTPAGSASCSAVGSGASVK